MGDPKKIRKKYETPSHPWIKSRIELEKKLSREFGTANKKELWKMETVLKKFKNQAKKLISSTSEQSKVETQHLFRRIKELGLAEGEVTFDTILGLNLEDVLGRRLQSIVYKKGLAHTVKQARQFIVHEHIQVGGKVITSPSYLVSVKEESEVGFVTSSPLFSEDHPERASPERLKELEEAKKAAAAAKAKKEAEAEKEANAEAGEDAGDEKEQSEPTEEKAEDSTEPSEEGGKEE
jgi:small subunit ribosomal protein S4